MGSSISLLRSQKDGGSRSSSTSSVSEVSSTGDRGSDTSFVDSDSSELQDNSSTNSGNSTVLPWPKSALTTGRDLTDSTTFSSTNGRRGSAPTRDDELSSYTRDLLDLRALRALHALYLDSLGRSPPMDVKQRGASVDSIRAVCGSPRLLSERLLEFQSSRESDEAAETPSPRRPNASGQYTAQSSTRYPNSGRD